MVKKSDRTIKMDGGFYNEGDNFGIQVGGDVNISPDNKDLSKRNTKPQSIVNTNVDFVEIRRILVSRFNETELRDLCFDLNIDYENLQGSSKQDRSRELLTLVQRHGLERKFLQTLKIHRPELFK